MIGLTFFPTILILKFQEDKIIFVLHYLGRIYNCSKYLKYYAVHSLLICF